MDDEALTAAERRLVTAVFAATGHALENYRVNPLRRRIRAVLRSLRAATIDEAIAKISSTPRLAIEALCSLLIGYTCPFRDAAVFARLEAEILPVLAARGGIRAWSIACSDGSELRSVALLLASRGALEQSQLRGSDSRAAAVVKAKTSAREFWRAVPAAFGGLKCMVDEGDFLAQSQRIEWRHENVFSHRNRVHFDRGQWDLVLCRNLAIYLEPAAAWELWRIAADAVAPGGFLITGKAERPTPSSAWRRLHPCIYQAVK